MRRLRVTDTTATWLVGFNAVGLLGAIAVGWPVAGIAVVVVALSSFTVEPPKGGTNS